MADEDLLAAAILCAPSPSPFPSPLAFSLNILYVQQMTGVGMGSTQRNK